MSEYFGNTIIAFFTDEPCALGRNAGQFREWLRGLEKEIMAAGGWIEDLEAIFNRSDDVEEELYFHIPGQDLIMRRVSPESGDV